MVTQRSKILSQRVQNLVITQRSEMVRQRIKHK